MTNIFGNKALGVILVRETGFHTLNRSLCCRTMQPLVVQVILQEGPPAHMAHLRHQSNEYPFCRMSSVSHG